MKRFSFLLPLIVITTAVILPLSTISCRGEDTTPAQQTAISLPVPELRGKVSLEEALSKRRSVRSYTDQPLTLQQVAQLLWAAQGITDPATGHRTAPSAMAKYPLTVFLVAGNVTGLPAGIYQYEPKGHQITLKIPGDQRKSVSSQKAAQQAPIMLVITGNYSVLGTGAKATPYTNIEAGAAGQNVLLEATAMGLGAVGMGGFSDEQVMKALGSPKDLSPLYIIAAGRK